MPCHLSIMLCSAACAKGRLMYAQEYLQQVLKQKSAPFSEPWSTILNHTPLDNIKVFIPSDKLPHTNKAPVVCIGDSCHPMVPYSGTCVHLCVCVCVCACMCALHKNVCVCALHTFVCLCALMRIHARCLYLVAPYIHINARLHPQADLPYCLRVPSPYNMHLTLAG